MRQRLRFGGIRWVLSALVLSAMGGRPARALPITFGIEGEAGHYGGYELRLPVRNGSGALGLRGTSGSDERWFRVPRGLYHPLRSAIEAIAAEPAPRLLRLDPAGGRPGLVAEFRGELQLRVRDGVVRGVSMLPRRTADTRGRSVPLTLRRGAALPFLEASAFPAGSEDYYVWDLVRSAYVPLLLLDYDAALGEVLAAFSSQFWPIFAQYPSEQAPGTKLDVVRFPAVGLAWFPESRRLGDGIREGGEPFRLVESAPAVGARLRPAFLEGWSQLLYDAESYNDRYFGLLGFVGTVRAVQSDCRRLLAHSR